MIYPADFEARTSFLKIRQELSARCISNAGREHVDHLQCSSEYSAIREKLILAEEFRRVMMSGISFPSQDYFDMRRELARLRVAGTYMEPETMGETGASLRTLMAIRDYFRGGAEAAFPGLKLLADEIIINPGILQAIERIINDKSEIRDDASPLLEELRKKQIQQKRQVEKRIRLICQQLKKDGIAGDESEITIRSGRSVIPLPASNKRRIRGFVHDESATGQTVYIEPEEIFDLNNGIRELESAEKREIIRILTAFSDELRPDIPMLNRAYELMGLFDFLRAKAILALDTDAALPRFSSQAGLDFRKARNPLLFLSVKHKRSEVVPLDVALDEDNRILIISGPNAGGKSVCLKTIGLLQYMLQCGLLIPLREDSETGVFNNFFMEIGDDQSIENDLSTYSSHLRNIRVLTETAAPGMLFLIDEFGSGTEPQPGGAIAESVLMKMAESGAWGVVTTHYMNLKLMAGRIPGIFNGAMLFDIRGLKPLFELSVGQPGSSFAFEIAAKTGLDAEILRRAAEIGGSAGLDFEKQLAALESDRRALEKERLEFSVADELLADLIRKYNLLLEKLESSKKQILEDARSKAEDLIREANSRIELTIKTIKEAEASKESTKNARESLEEFRESLKKERTEKLKEEKEKEAKEKTLIRTKPEKSVFVKAPLEAGGYARIRGQETFVEIAAIQGGFAMVVHDNIRLRIPLEHLEGCEKPREKKDRQKNRYAGYADEMNEKRLAFQPKIDVRGKRADELLPLLRSFIDDALLLGIREVTVLHGKGNGILRSIVRDYLAGIPEVQSCKDEAPERGGSGISLIRFH